MGELFDRIESPVLSDIELAWEGVSVEDVYPLRVPDLFRARPLVVHGRLNGRGPGRLLVRGNANGKPYAEAVPFDTGQAAFHPGITILWARRAVEERMDAWRAADGEERASRRGEIVDFAVRHHLVCAFTSLVAVEERVVNEGGESRRVAVPAELPEGWQLDKVVGENPVGGTADAFLELTGLWLVAVGAFLLMLRRGVEGRQ
jgi:Ca-activated chloride channel family protein